MRLAHLPQGLSLHVSEGDSLCRRGFYKALQRRRYTEQIPTFHGDADSLRHLYGQGRAIFFLQLQLHMATGNCAQCDQCEADQQAQPRREDCQLLTEAGIAEAAIHASMGGLPGYYVRYYKPDPAAIVRFVPR